jgi:hypothetical protein
MLAANWRASSIFYFDVRNGSNKAPSISYRKRKERVPVILSKGESALRRWKRLEATLGRSWCDNQVRYNDRNARMGVHGRFLDTTDTYILTTTILTPKAPVGKVRRFGS